MNGLRKVWKESASLILLSKTPQNLPPPPSSKFNYEVLVLKRSTGSKFMASAIVFPGGVTEKPDSSGDWLDLYSKLGVNEGRLNSLKSLRNSDFIYKKSSEEEHIERELSLRITAIRETFEEVGVLLAKSQDELKRNETGLYTSALSGFDRKFWQKEVQSNPSRFFDLCQTLQVVPDVFALHGWSNWLTPTTVGKHRFDTMFYVACLPDRPALEMDQKEVERVAWATPRDLLDSSQEKKIFLPPPQLYELGKLNGAPDFDQVARFAKWRGQFGTTLIFPVQYIAKGKLVHVLPGDDLYPKEPSYFAKNEDISKYEDQTAEELRAQAKNLHRTDHESMFNSEMHMNIAPFDQHLCPLGNNNSIEDFKTKAKL